MRWLDYFRGKLVEPSIEAGHNFGYRIDASAFPVVVYHNTGHPMLSALDFFDKLPKVGDPHLYREDMFVVHIEIGCGFKRATVTYKQGSQVVLPTMEVVWQPPA